MDEYLNNRHKEIFLRLLTNPADTGGVYLVNLQELVKAHPQSGLLRAMYGRALNESTPVVAGGYFDNRALHKLLYHTDSLLAVDAKQIVFESDNKALNAYAAIPEEVVEEETSQLHENVDTPQQTSSEMLTDLPTTFPDALKVDLPAAAETKATPTPTPEEPQQEITPAYTEPVAETHEPAPVEEEPLGRAPWEIDEDEAEITPPVPATAVQEDIPQEYIAPEPEPVNQELPAESFAAEIQAPVTEPAPVVAERTPWELIAEEYAAQAAKANEQATNTGPVEFKAESYINEETYEEITGIEDIAIPAHHSNSVAFEPVTAETEEAGNIKSNNYFSFDHAFSEHKNGSTITSAGPEAAAQENEPVSEENAAHHNDVSRYHDEKMPYTFMWWLDKTRKEHDATYQPYVKAPGNYDNKPGKKGKPDELQQQYFENIFHLSPLDSITNIVEPQTIEFDMHNKEDRLIKRFITEDPHIHPPLGERLDTENKAKRSSEDDYDMVTETLARIYADQMLFPKAIATYRKLMLKFPEKSRYFASRIDALEKRTN